MSVSIEHAKQLVLSYYTELETATQDTVASIVQKYVSQAYTWYGVHPFNKQNDRQQVIEIFWKPFYASWSHVQRRQDIFIAGKNIYDNKIWTISMGHFLGIRQAEWLGIPSNNAMTFLRYAEFHCVENDSITQSAFFCDMIDVMQQSGIYPLPMQTGASFLYPGPRTHDGLLYKTQVPEEGEKTLNLLNTMIDDLDTLNKTGNDECNPKYLERTWHKDMIWYGPTGIGATYTIPLFQKQHQYPFRKNLKDKTFNGHICRFAEGQYAGFFGWPNLTNTPTGGFLGLPASKPADMRVVDIYRREHDKLAENWVFIDIPYWLLQQGLDVFARCKELV